MDRARRRRWLAADRNRLRGSVGRQDLGDVTAFLRNLIAHNTVLYQTDFNSREWAFIYYLENATRRLESIADQRPPILGQEMLDAASFSTKDAWSNAQSALDIAIANFAKVLDDNDPA